MNSPIFNRLYPAFTVGTPPSPIWINPRFVEAIEGNRDAQGNAVTILLISNGATYLVNESPDYALRILRRAEQARTYDFASRVIESVDDLRRRLADIERPDCFCEDCADDADTPIQVPAIWVATERYPGNGYADTYLCGDCAMKWMERESERETPIPPEGVSSGWHYCAFELRSNVIFSLRQSIAAVESLEDLPS